MFFVGFRCFRKNRISITIILIVFFTVFLVKLYSPGGGIEPRPVLCTERATVEMQRRVEHVRNICKAYHLGAFAHATGENDLGVKDPPTPQYSYFFLNKEKRLAWCPVYKAGSTSWLQNMLLLAGISEDTLAHPPGQLSIWAREIYGEPVPDKDFENARKMLIVRHPFRRILSAYRDKLENSSRGLEHGTAHFYTKYGQKIVQKFRTNLTLVQNEPTFEEFVKYLISTDLVQYSDDHWLPIYYSCTPCRIQYSFIAKVETLTSDQNCLIEALGLRSILQPKWAHKTSTDKEDDIISKYFSQLTKYQIEQLALKYKLDFLFYNYTHLPFVQFGKA